MKNAKRLFEKRYLATVREADYHYMYLGSNNFQISSIDGTALALFDVPKMIPNCMRARLSQVYREQWHHIFPNEFRLESPAQNEVYFNSEEEFFEAVDTLVTDTLKCLFLLEQNKKMLVVPKNDYYMELADGTLKKTKKFVQENHLEYLPSSMLGPWAKQWLQEHYLNQKNMIDMQDALEGDLPLFLSFCAYCGEVYRREKNGTWTWYQDEESKGYVILWEGGGIDILGQVTEYLSYSLIVQTQRLFD